MSVKLVHFSAVVWSDSGDYDHILCRSICMSNHLITDFDRQARMNVRSEWSHEFSLIPAHAARYIRKDSGMCICCGFIQGALLLTEVYTLFVSNYAAVSS